jgi:hypothetical protein
MSISGAAPEAGYKVQESDSMEEPEESLRKPPTDCT